MQIINNGIEYSIIDGGSMFLDRLPPKVFSVCFSKMRGNFLSERLQPIAETHKIYGNTPVRVDKIFKTFSIRDRNLGVLLSGCKGMGKTVFMRHLSNVANKMGYPVIIVDNNLPGISDFISKIEQEVVVIFDEFEKTFLKDGEIEGDQQGGQTQFLTLFDGMGGGKKLFVVAVNETYRLSQFFINRPGRFFYHFKFKYLNGDDVREYCADNLNNDVSGDVIDKLVTISNLHNINYDSLSAIVSELNNGYTLRETVNDLNIDIDETEKLYDLQIEVEGVLYSSRCWIGEDSRDRRCFPGGNDGDFSTTMSPVNEVGNCRNYINVTFNMEKAIYDKNGTSMSIPTNGLHVNSANGNEIDASKLSSLLIKPHQYGISSMMEFLA